MPRRLGRLRTGRAAVSISCSYLGYFAAVGCLMPYIALYYRQLQLTGVQIGVLTAILPLGIAFVAPMWGALADTFSVHRLVLRGALILAALTALQLAYATTFLAFLPLMSILATCLAAVPALLDSYAMMICDRDGASFGQLRVWGSVGYILAVWLVAWKMGANISSLFLYAYAAALLFTCSATFGLPALQARSAQRMWQGVSAIARQRSVLLLLLSVFFITSNATIMSSFFSIYLTDIGGTAQLVGTASAFAALSEMPVMVFGRRLLDRFNSRNILVLAVSVYVLRLGLYSLPPTVAWLLAIQWLHGLSFGLYLMASVTLVHELAGRERAATAQGLLSSIALGFGAITGSLVGGSLLDRIGSVGIFRVAAVGMCVALAVCIFSVRLAGSRSAVASPTLQARCEQS